jgi:rRNA-processing protein FCF1
VDRTIDELKGIEASGKGRDSLAAKLALQLLKHHMVMQLKTKNGKSVDDLIVDLADKDTIVATQDAELKRRVKKKKAKLIVMRQKKYLALM